MVFAEGPSSMGVSGSGSGSVDMSGGNAISHTQFNGVQMGGGGSSGSPSIGSQGQVASIGNRQYSQSQQQQLMRQQQQHLQMQQQQVGSVASPMARISYCKSEVAHGVLHVPQSSQMTLYSNSWLGHQRKTDTSAPNQESEVADVVAYVYADVKVNTQTS